MNVNPLTFDFGLPIGAAGVVFPSLRRYYVAVDSTQDLYTGKALRGRYRLRYWVNDLRPPVVRLLTRRVAVGRPTLAIRAQDSGAGVDPYSMLIAYQGVAVAAAAYDSSSGIAIFVLPSEAPRAPARAEPDSPRGVRLPGVEEREHLRAERDAEHSLPLREHPRRARDDDDVAAPAATRLPAGESAGAARAREHDEPDPARALLQRASPDRDGSDRRRRALLDHVARGARRARASTGCGRSRSRLAAGRRAPRDVVRVCR